MRDNNTDLRPGKTNLDFSTVFFQDSLRVHDRLEPKGWWKKQLQAAVVLTSVAPLHSQTKPLCFFKCQKNFSSEILSSHSGPNLLALHETVIQLHGADEEA